MFDFAWSELMVIGLVALVVIGPKDLPRVLRIAGKWAGKARVIAREFQGSIDQMIRESELDEVRREVQKVAEIDLDHHIESTVDPEGELAKSMAPPIPLDGPPAALPALEAGAATPETAAEPAPAVTPAVETRVLPPAGEPGPSKTPPAT